MCTNGHIVWYHAGRSVRHCSGVAVLRSRECHRALHGRQACPADVGTHLPIVLCLALAPPILLFSKGLSLPSAGKRIHARRSGGGWHNRAPRVLRPPAAVGLRVRAISEGPHSFNACIWLCLLFPSHSAVTVACAAHCATCHF